LWRSISLPATPGITRVATKRNESVLLNIAFHGTTWHVEQGAVIQQALAAVMDDLFEERKNVSAETFLS
jgi:hypothetical protein